MSRIISSKREIIEIGTYQVDRIGDEIMCDLDERKVIKPTDYGAALKFFEEEETAYALRFLPSPTIFSDDRGQLVAYKECDFPKDLPFLIYQMAALPSFHFGISKESDDGYVEFVKRTTQYFTDFYQHFPELMTAFHRELYMGMCHIQFSAIGHDTKKVDSWSEYLGNLIEDYIGSSTRREDNGSQFLLHNQCLAFLGMDEEIQSAESEHEGPFDTSGKTVQTKLGANVTCRENVIQAVESMFWNDVDQILIQEQMKLFREDLIHKDLDNPMVYLEDENEILSLEHPGELYRFIMMDDFWIRQFTYWLFNKHIEIFFQIASMPKDGGNEK